MKYKQYIMKFVHVHSASKHLKVEVELFINNEHTFISSIKHDV